MRSANNEDWRKNMARMTEEEAAALDDLLTKTTPRLTGIPGVFARQKAAATAPEERLRPKSGKQYRPTGQERVSG
jgi:hypothetical protein